MKIFQSLTTFLIVPPPVLKCTVCVNPTFFSVSIIFSSFPALRQQIQLGSWVLSRAKFTFFSSRHQCDCCELLSCPLLFFLGQANDCVPFPPPPPWANCFQQFGEWKNVEYFLSLCGLKWLGAVAVAVVSSHIAHDSSAWTMPTSCKNWVGCLGVRCYSQEGGMEESGRRRVSGHLENFMLVLCTVFRYKTADTVWLILKRHVPEKVQGIGTW